MRAQDSLALEDEQAVERLPLRKSAAYDGRTQSIGDARKFTQAFLSRVQSVQVSPSSLAMAQLVVSELVTNACKYAPGRLLLDLEVDKGVLAVTVWDTDPGLPAALGSDPGRVGRHGLEIILAVSRSIDAHREPVGKRITALIGLTGELTDPT
ncbi:ATP-binding protein [Streptomyces sp. NPDC058864]